jgi:hypothetical protein
MDSLAHYIIKNSMIYTSHLHSIVSIQKSSRLCWAGHAAHEYIINEYRVKCEDSNHSEHLEDVG